MVPRAGQKAPVALVDPARCVACGVCVGACQTEAVQYPFLDFANVSSQIDRYMDEVADMGQECAFAFLCTNSAAADLQINTTDGICLELPGFRSIAVPCAGWIHPGMIRRALEKGAKGVLISGCNSADAFFRTGALAAEMRFTDRQDPKLGRHKLGDAPVAYEQFDITRKGDFLQAAAAFRANGSPPARRILHQGPKGLVASLAAFMLFSLLAVWLSDTDSAVAGDSSPELVVSFKHPGAFIESQGGQKERNKDLLPHMRQAQTVNRERSPVRLQVLVDGTVVVDQSYPPGGLYGDMASIALERIPVPSGAHEVRVRIGETPDPQEWTYIENWTVTFRPYHRDVILFDKGEGFRWH
jgi:coenzyme F420-reducing hydrogenase delta subunit